TQPEDEDQPLCTIEQRRTARPFGRQRYDRRCAAWVRDRGRIGSVARHRTVLAGFWNCTHFGFPGRTNRILVLGSTSTVEPARLRICETSARYSRSKRLFRVCGVSSWASARMRAVSTFARLTRSAAVACAAARN